MGANRTLLFQTGNAGKLSEASELFDDLGIDIEQFLIDGSPPEIDEPAHDGLVAVANSKLSQGLELLKAHGLLSQMMLVEDSGLFIEAMPNYPGAYSARVLEAEGLDGVLSRVSHLESPQQRKAEFRCAAAMWTGSIVISTVGICRGHLTLRPRGEGGFGYDPIFIPDDVEDFSTNGLTFGEVDSTTKAKFSHRGIALRTLHDALSSL
jgi:XTP/dITP diphosphohydrolase